MAAGADRICGIPQRRCGKAHPGEDKSPNPGQRLGGVVECGNGGTGRTPPMTGADGDRLAEDHLVRAGAGVDRPPRRRAHRRDGGRAARYQPTLSDEHPAQSDGPSRRGEPLSVGSGGRRAAGGTRAPGPARQRRRPFLTQPQAQTSATDVGAGRAGHRSASPGAGYGRTSATVTWSRLTGRDRVQIIGVDDDRPRRRVPRLAGPALARTPYPAGSADIEGDLMRCPAHIVPGPVSGAVLVPRGSSA